MRPADILPDCTRCGGRVDVDTDLPEGPTEICRDCGLGQPVPGVWTRGEIRERARLVVAADRRGEL